MSMGDFSQLSAHEMTKQTNNKIDNHTLVTEILMKDIRDVGLKSFTGQHSYRSAVINVGVLETNLVQEKVKFKSKEEEADYDVYQATSNY
jgi:aspartate aminotransferase-like enzyme